LEPITSYKRACAVLFYVDTESKFSDIHGNVSLRHRPSSISSLFINHSYAYSNIRSIRILIFQGTAVQPSNPSHQQFRFSIFPNQSSLLATVRVEKLQKKLCNVLSYFHVTQLTQDISPSLFLCMPLYALCNKNQTFKTLNIS
jgi:hypothetical protein